METADNRDIDFSAIGKFSIVRYELASPVILAVTAWQAHP